VNRKRLLYIFIQVVVGATILGVAAVLLLDHFEIVETVKPYVVMSASMEPAVKLGSVVVVKPQTSYKPNDIVTFTPEGNKENLVTHRVVFRRFSEGLGSAPVYLTAGDANEEMDRWQVRNDQVIGKVVLSIPYLGYAVNFAKQPYGFIFLVIVPATIVIYEELKSVRREVAEFFKKLREKYFKKRRTIDLLDKGNQNFPKAAAFVPFLGAVLVMASLTGSYFFDLETSLANLLGAAESFGETPTESPQPNQTQTVFLDQLGEDIEDQYGYPHDYANAVVSFTYTSPANPRLGGTINATGLKPYASYQVKFQGIPTCIDSVNGNDLANEYIGYKGRWTCPGCSGDANARNRNDAQYEENKAKSDTDPTKVCIVGYLVWDFFTADLDGKATAYVETVNSYHVLRCGGGSCNSINDDFLDFLDSAYPSIKFCPTDKVNGEIEAVHSSGRSSCNDLSLDAGIYHLQMSLTEESFHQGSWATVLVGEIDFEI
jgi:signal peptidase I